MAVSYQLVIDCTSPELPAHFWAEALHYVIAPRPPASTRGTTSTGRSVYPRTSLARTPTGSRIRMVRVRASGCRSSPEKKSIKNRIHIDVNASGGRDVSLDIRRERVQAEARLISLGATRLSLLSAWSRLPVRRTAAMSDKPFLAPLPGGAIGLRRVRSWQVSWFFLSPR